MATDLCDGVFNPILLKITILRQFSKFASLPYSHFEDNWIFELSTDFLSTWIRKNVAGFGSF